jgi:putative ABC transport system permease protein
VYIPYTTAQRIFPAAAETPDKVDIIHIGSRDEKNTQVLIRKIKRFLHMRHRLDPEAPHDFTVFDQNTISSVIDETACTINFFILIAASISLLVAGIGVMNIMLVSVRERTQEIGIRLALGATPFLIQLQFLVESIILCLAGGILGIVVGIAPPLLLRYYELFPAKIELMPTLSALIVTVCIGLFFGFYPARLASKLDPIQALQER